MSEITDIVRLKQEYQERKNRFDGEKLYSRFSPAHLYSMQHLERDVVSLLRNHNISELTQTSLLEVGCGSGGVLLQYMLLGVRPQNLWGLDIRFDPLPGAKKRILPSSILNANGAHIPARKQAFDLILQYTAFSSILDEKLKQNMAAEMLRVLKPGGFILWYDFWLNPTNKQTQGIKPAEIRALFPNCHVNLKKVTLAPPIARRIAPFSWGLANFLESLKLFNSHYLALIQPI